MNLLGNILWIVFGGFAMFVGYVIGGTFLCLTIVGIPFGLQVFKLAVLALFPFGQKIYTAERASGCLYIFMNVVWLIFFGIGLAISHVLIGAVLAITIIGIPFTMQHFKLARLALTPFGMDVR
jgi:uncharacterized membrane protein YccF (DUF307 family)